MLRRSARVGSGWPTPTFNLGTRRPVKLHSVVGPQPAWPKTPKKNFGRFSSFLSSTRPIDSAVHRTHNRDRHSVESPTRVVVDVVCDFEARRGIPSRRHKSRPSMSLLGAQQLVAWAASEAPDIISHKEPFLNGFPTSTVADELARFARESLAGVMRPTPRRLGCATGARKSQGAGSEEGSWVAVLSSHHSAQAAEGGKKQSPAGHSLSLLRTRLSTSKFGMLQWHNKSSPPASPRFVSPCLCRAAVLG